MTINIWDIDGCMILGFSMGYNEAENAERLRNQPRCEPFCEYAYKESLHCINYVATGRKNFSVGDVTRKIVKDVIGDDVHLELFPDNATYDTYWAWKIAYIEGIIDANPNEIIRIYDDDRKIAQHFSIDERVIVHWVQSDLNEFKFKPLIFV